MMLDQQMTQMVIFPRRGPVGQQRNVRKNGAIFGHQSGRERLLGLRLHFSKGGHKHAAERNERRTDECVISPSSGSTRLSQRLR